MQVVTMPTKVMKQVQAHDHLVQEVCIWGCLGLQPDIQRPLQAPRHI